MCVIYQLVADTDIGKSSDGTGFRAVAIHNIRAVFLNTSPDCTYTGHIISGTDRIMHRSDVFNMRNEVDKLLIVIRIRTDEDVLKLIVIFLHLGQ